MNIIITLDAIVAAECCQAVVLADSERHIGRRTSLCYMADLTISFSAFCVWICESWSGFCISTILLKINFLDDCKALNKINSKDVR